MIKVKLKYLALDKGIKLIDVAKQTDIHQNNLYPLANGQTQQISFKYLEKLCKFFQCTPSDILEITED